MSAWKFTSSDPVSPLAVQYALQQRFPPGTHVELGKDGLMGDISLPIGDDRIESRLIGSVFPRVKATRA